MLVRHVLSQLSYAPEAFACWALATLKQRSLLYPKPPHLSIGFFQFFIFLLQRLLPPKTAQNTKSENPLGHKAFLPDPPLLSQADTEADREKNHGKTPGTAVRRDIFLKKIWPPAASFRRVKGETVKKIFRFPACPATFQRHPHPKTHLPRHRAGAFFLRMRLLCSGTPSFARRSSAQSSFSSSSNSSFSKTWTASQNWQVISARPCSSISERNSSLPMLISAPRIRSRLQ